MVKGSESKSIFYAKILETFEGSFMYNDGKEIRIPYTHYDDLCLEDLLLETSSFII